MGNARDFRLEATTTVFDVGPGYCVAGWRNVLINCVQVAASVRILRATHLAHQQLIREHPGGLGVLTTMDALPRLPDAETRRLAAKSIRDTAGEVIAQASVVAADGFVGSAVRSAMAAVNMLAQAPNPTLVTGSEQEAVRWLAGHLAPNDTGAWGGCLLQAVGDTKDRVPA